MPSSTLPTMWTALETNKFTHNPLLIGFRTYEQSLAKNTTMQCAYALRRAKLGTGYSGIYAGADQRFMNQSSAKLIHESKFGKIGFQLHFN
jgi:hypothetical protein